MNVYMYVCMYQFHDADNTVTNVEIQMLISGNFYSTLQILICVLLKIMYLLVL